MSDIDEAIAAILAVRGKRENVRVWSKLLASVPKCVYEHASGRDQSLLNRQADNYNLPLRGERMNLAATIKRFHDIFSEQKQKQKPEDDNVAADTERLKRDLLQAKLDKEQGRLVDRNEVRRRISFLQRWIFNLGDWLGNRHGAEVQRDINERLRGLAEEFKSGAINFDDDIPGAE